MITVAIPLFNGEKFLESAVKSVTEQTHQIETLLIVDDASTDNSPQLVECLKKKYLNCNIEYYKNETNLGYPSNWNKCFKLCKTRFLVILHQDDILKKDSISKLLTFLQSHQDCALVGGYEDFIDAKGDTFFTRKSQQTKLYKKGEIYEFVTSHSSYIACTSVMFDMEKIKNVGYFDTDVIGTDELYWPKVLAKYPISVIGESLIYRRMHDDQTEYGDFVKYEKEARQIFEKFKRIADYESRPQQRKELHRFLRFKFSRGWIGIIALSLAKRGYRLMALKYIGRAILLYPAIIFYFPKMWKSFVRIIVFSLGFRNIMQKV